MLKSLKLATLLFCLSGTTQALEIFVSDAGGFSNPPWQILKYDEDGANPEVFIDSNLAWPQDIVFLDDSVLISNLNSGNITRYNAVSGEYEDNFATGIGGPTRMRIGPDGLLYVLQWTGNGRVLRYQTDGSFVDEFTTTPVSQSIGLDWDQTGNLYVSSFGGRHVRRFSPSGADLGLFISNNLAGPTNIWFDDSGELLVSDYSGGSIKRFDADGNFIGTFVGGLQNSEGVAFLANGNILIGNGGTAAVKMYTAQGDFIRDIVSSGSGGLRTPNAIVLRENQLVLNAGLNDAWFNAETAGQGFFIIVYPELAQMFLSWFTFDTSSPDPATSSNLGWAGHRWLTAQGPIDGNRAILDVAVTSGGQFDSSSPSPTTQTGRGTIEVSFSDCESGTVNYDLPDIDRSGSISIARVAPDNVALCNSLAEQAATTVVK